MWHTLIGLLFCGARARDGRDLGPEVPGRGGGAASTSEPAHSWLLGDDRFLSMILGISVGLALIAAGIGFLTDMPWWPGVGVIAAAASLVLFAVFFTPWWTVGIGISVALLLNSLQAVETV